MLSQIHLLLFISQIFRQFFHKSPYTEKSRMSQAKVEVKILILTTKPASAIRKVIVCINGCSTMAALLSVGEPVWAFTKPDYEAQSNLLKSVHECSGISSVIC